MEIYWAPGTSLKRTKLELKVAKGKIQPEVEKQFEEIAVRLILMSLPMFEINRRVREMFLYGFCH
jgi:hypothetical protein